MPTLDVSPEVYSDVQLLARALGTNPDGVLRRLIDDFRSSGSPTRTDADPRTRHIHAIYDGNRVDAVYEPETRRVVVTSGPLAGRAFRTPSGAAIAVVRLYRPDVNPNRNGWTFWTLTDNGHLLQSIREQGYRGSADD